MTENEGDTMEEMRIYIANLGKYNEGELVGAWFTPPVDFEEVKERIGLNDEYEEYAIHDYELPFEIDEYTPIEEVNRLCEMVEDLPEYIQEELSELQSYFGSIEELCEHEDDIICHSGCDDMADVARCYLEESGQLGELPAHLQTISTTPPMGVTWNWREPLLSRTTAYMKSYGRPVCISFRKYRRIFYSGAALLLSPSFRKDGQHEENTKLYQYLVGGKGTLFHQ